MRIAVSKRLSFFLGGTRDLILPRYYRHFSSDPPVTTVATVNFRCIGNTNPWYDLDTFDNGNIRARQN